MISNTISFGVVAAVLVVFSSIVVVLVVSAALPPPFVRDVRCVARPNQPLDELRGALGWVCAHVNCNDMPPNATTVQEKADWAFSQYYEQNDQSQIGTCQFGSVAMLDCPANDMSKKVNKKKFIGVNLGGSGVLEPWITPSLFKQFVGKPLDEIAIDQYHFGLKLPVEEATKQLTQHYETWITEQDIIEIAAYGFTHVRFPVGFWCYSGLLKHNATNITWPYVAGDACLKFSDNVFAWCEKHGVKILLDLHTAVGSSQNGFDNSGTATWLWPNVQQTGTPIKKCASAIGGVSCPAHPLWGSPSHPEYIDQTLEVLAVMTRRYRDSPAFDMLECINEPRLIDKKILMDFYTRCYEQTRSIAGADLTVVFHDGFYALDWMNKLTPAQGFHNVILDTHIYEGFGAGGEDKEAHLQEACGYTRNTDFMACNEADLIVGEWSLSTTDCAKWLDGFGTRPSSPLCKQMPPRGGPSFDNSFYEAYARRQLSAFLRSSRGVFFWTWKTEESPLWSMQYILKNTTWYPKNFPREIDPEIYTLCNFTSVAP